MSQSIPLGATLRVKVKHIVIDSPRCLVPYLMHKGLSAKHRHGGHGHLPVQRHAVAGLDLFRCIGDHFWSQEIQRPQLV